MAEVRTMARPYARAVFAVARDAKALTAWSQGLEAVAEIVTNADVVRVMNNPEVTPAQLADSIIAIAGDHLPQQAQAYVRLLADNRRLVLAPAIAEQFETMRAAVEQRVDVTVVSAVPFSQQQQQALSVSLQQRLDAEVALTFDHDAELIGGAVIRVGDLVLDHSLRSQLARMQQNLTP